MDVYFDEIDVKYGKRKVATELKPGGSDIKVTEKNKLDYLQVSFRSLILSVVSKL